ncbi:MAG: hypothetical protein WC045_02385 [Patescibacteria group bacterium]
MKTQKEKEIIPNIIINNTGTPPKWGVTVPLVLFVLLVVTNFDSLGSFIRSYSSSTAHDVNDAEARVIELTKYVEVLKNDRVILEEASNAMLAIQEYYFENKEFPKSLKDLADTKNLRFIVLDIDDTKDVYYERRETDFVFCVRLSDGVKGVNTKACKITK